MNPIKRFLASIAAALCGSCFLPGHRQTGAIRPGIFFAKSDEQPGNPATLEEQLGAARNDLATRDQTILSLTAERDQARNDLATRDASILNLTRERDEARNDVTARDTSLAASTRERDEARNESAARATRITQLESALGAQGVSVSDLPKVPAVKPGPALSVDSYNERFASAKTAHEREAILAEFHKAAVEGKLAVS